MMANSKGSSDITKFMCSRKHALLPPKSPFPIMAPSYNDYVESPAIGSKVIHKPRERNTHHLTSSESLLIEEQPSWLDDLLNEPETPVRRGGHRRSSSDSLAYTDSVTSSNIDFTAQDEHTYKNLISMSSLGSQDFDNHKDAWHASLYAVNSARQKNRAWESSLNAVTRQSSLPTAWENNFLQRLGSSCATLEPDRVSSTASEKQDHVDFGLHDPKASTEGRDSSHAKILMSETDTKRAKQQFAQRSRVRKLQYIAELERNVQSLQGEGSEVSAELNFINQQNLILSMENKALKQRLESLTQEKIIKYLEQEVLEREIGRLRAVYQQQQQQPSSRHQRSSSRDLDTQFANLSLKHTNNNSGHDLVSGSLRI